MMAKLSVKWHTARLNRFVRKATKDLDNRAAEAITKKTMFDVLALVIDFTPVDTGRARGGWTAAADHFGIPYQISGPNVSAAAIDLGRSESTFDTIKSPQGTVFRVSNSVPYIQVLEYGWSDQAPAGMVRLAIRTYLNEGTVDNVVMEEIKETIRKADREAGRGRKNRAR